MALQVSRYFDRVAVSFMYTMDIDGTYGRCNSQKSYQLLYCHLCREMFPRYDAAYYGSWTSLRI